MAIDEPINCNYTLEGMIDESVWTVNNDVTTIESTGPKNYTLEAMIDETTTWTAKGDETTTESINEPNDNYSNSIIEDESLLSISSATDNFKETFEEQAPSCRDDSVESSDQNISVFLIKKLS